MDALIVVDRFCKAYGDRVAVSNLSFEVRAGQVLGLLGSNGSGKTTTMRAVSGIIRATSGRISVAGCWLETDSVQAKQQLAYVPDDAKLFDTLTVWEHLQFIAAAYRVRDFEPTAVRLLEQFGLMMYRDTVARALSRGARQKTSICCAYLHDPQVILLDEPLTGLDQSGLRTMKESVRERSRSGAAVVISSHLLTLVEDLCTHLLILRQGQSVFCGRIEEARRAFGAHDADTPIEELFLRATEASGSSLIPAA